MGYINDFRAKLTALIKEGKTAEAVKFAADKVLESYHNGAGLIDKAVKNDVPHATASRGERKAERFEKRVKQNVPRRNERSAGRHYQT